MKDRQRKLYEEQIGVQEKNPSRNSSKNDTSRKKWFFFGIKQIFASHKSILSIAMIAVLIWNFGGQLLLEAELRFATYMGNRAGDFLNAEIKTSLPQEAQKASVIASEQAQVEVEKNCINLRNDNALRAFYECQASGGTQYLCDFRRNEILKQPCDPFVARQLDKTSPTPQPKGE